MSQMHAVPTNPKAFGIQDHLIATSFHLKSHGYQPEVRVREMFVDDDLSKENRPARFATVNPIEKAALARPTDGLSGKELEFLANYISGTGFYVESLEEYLGETLGDFCRPQSKAHMKDRNNRLIKSEFAFRDSTREAHTKNIARGL
jgi:hypothetical protein